MVQRLALILVVVLAAAPAVAQPAGHLLYTLHGDSPGDRLGHSLSMAGDVDGDSHTDFIVGIRFDDNNGLNSGTVRVYSGIDGRLLYSIDGDGPGDELGFSVSGAGDVNGDGFADFIAGAPGDDNRGTDSGTARVYSGKDGAVLFSVDGDLAFDNFGSSVSGAGDVNLDGYADFIVGAPNGRIGGSSNGTARIYSGKDGKVLFPFSGTALGDRFGSFVRDAGDCDRDGHPDVVVGAPDNDFKGTNGGSATVFSGKDGTTLHTFYGDAAGDQLGTSVSGAGDVNGDGHADVIVGIYNSDLNGRDSGAARVLSGKDGAILHTFVGDRPGHRMGWHVGPGGDFDGDGYADVMSGKGWGDSLFDAGYTRLWSGRDGRLIREFKGYQVAGNGDLNGDGIPDQVTGSWIIASGNESGTVWVHSGARITLSSSVLALTTSGGNQPLAIDAGPAHGGRNYWMFGSVTGTRPGIQLAGIHIPLLPDVYTDIAMANVNTTVFANFRGQLDGVGRAAATLRVPALPPGAVTLYHAFVVYDNQGGFHLASNPVVLRIR